MGTGAPRRVYIDPWTARVTGAHDWANAHRFFRQVHRHLMLPTKIGTPIVSSLALVLLASLVTGIVTYKKWWRGFFRLPQRGDARRLAGDLHRLMGLWSIWFVALITITGIWYLVEALGGNAAVPALPGTTAVTSPPNGMALDQLVATAARAKPSLEIREIRFTERNGVIVLGQDHAWLVRDRVNGVAMDPDRKTVAMMIDGRNLSAHQRISEMADPLHFGTFGGLATKVIWFLFGAVLTAISVTGTIISAKRLAKADAEARGAFRAAWVSMGAWAYIATATVILSLLLTPGAIGAGS